MSADHVADEQSMKMRSARYLSHAVVEVRRVRWLPLFCHSAVLLDMSHHGFKLEFMGDVEAAPGSQYWLVIPLAPLGITFPKKLACQCEVRWHDEHRHRIGGVFLNPSPEEMLLIDQVVARLKTRGQI
jgi:hypothetical protein